MSERLASLKTDVGPIILEGFIHLTYGLLSVLLIGPLFSSSRSLVLASGCCPRHLKKLLLPGERIRGSVGRRTQIETLELPLSPQTRHGQRDHSDLVAMNGSPIECVCGLRYSEGLAKGALAYPPNKTTVNDIHTEAWSIKDGQVVPRNEDIVLKDGGRKVNATYLYAHLAESSKLAQTLNNDAATKIIRVSMSSASRIVRQYGGEIRSLDGDRVMAIFMGEDKNWNAVLATLGINWAVLEIIRPAIKSNWCDGEKFSDISHGIGIDPGEALIVRGGVRDHNDLISIGVVANVAAKLSELRGSYSIRITDRVRVELNDKLLTYDEGRKRVWNKLFDSVKVAEPIKRSSGRTSSGGLDERPRDR